MKPYEMSFAEFATAVKPSGAVNRFPSIGAGMDVFSYSVYMNGPLLTELPAHVQEHQFKDVMVHALTEKLQLNPASFRDNLKVAEIVATRSAWMSAVLERPLGQSSSLSDQIMEDYALLTNGMTHPWIKEELKKQQLLGSKLQPALDCAGVALGSVVPDRAPNEVSVGKVVAQSVDFTVQQTNEGEVVTHENRRLNALPIVGTEVMVSYYRGSGQVVDSLENVKVSAPFIDSESGDLAVMLEDGKGNEQVVLFNSVAGFDKFIKAHGMDSGLVRQAMDLREASPKVVAPPPIRQLVSGVYVETESKCLAIDYQENGAVYSALFGSMQQMETLAKEFGLGAKEIAEGKALEGGREEISEWNEKYSELELRADLAKNGFHDIQESTVNGMSYIGKIVAESACHVAQDVGRRVVVIHDMRALDKVAVVGDSLTVKYENDRGRVTNMVREGDGLAR